MLGGGVRFGFISLALLVCAGCNQDRLTRDKTSPFAPSLKLNAQGVDPMLVGHRLLEAEEYELALKAFSRAALREGKTPEVLSGMSAANLGLGRLLQAEAQMRRAVKSHETTPEMWNNLGVILLELGKTAESVHVFRKAYALSNGQNDEIRDNLRLALANHENEAYTGKEENDGIWLDRSHTNVIKIVSDTEPL